jgi:hypothetical protein
MIPGLAHLYKGGMDTPPKIADPVALLESLDSEALQRRLAELNAEADAVRLLLRAARRRERASARKAGGGARRSPQKRAA